MSGKGSSELDQLAAEQRRRPGDGVGDQHRREVGVVVAPASPQGFAQYVPVGVDEPLVRVDELRAPSAPRSTSSFSGMPAVVLVAERDELGLRGHQSEGALEVAVEAAARALRARDDEARSSPDRRLGCARKRSGLEQSSLIRQTQRRSVCARSDSTCASNSVGSGSKVAMQTAMSGSPSGCSGFARAGGGASRSTIAIGAERRDLARRRPRARADKPSSTVPGARVPGTGDRSPEAAAYRGGRVDRSAACAKRRPPVAVPSTSSSSASTRTPGWQQVPQQNTRGPSDRQATPGAGSRGPPEDSRRSPAVANGYPCPASVAASSTIAASDDGRTPPPSHPGLAASAPCARPGPGPEAEALRAAYLDLLKLSLCDLGGRQHDVRRRASRTAR